MPTPTTKCIVSIPMIKLFFIKTVSKFGHHLFTMVHFCTKLLFIIWRPLFVKNCRFKILKLLTWPEKLNIATDLKIHLVLGPKNTFQNRLFIKLHSFWFSNTQNSTLNLLKLYKDYYIDGRNTRFWLWSLGEDF